MREQQGPIREQRGPVRDEGNGRRFGNYELVRRIDVGGMGEVYLARQRTAFGREVAVKIIRSDLVHDLTARERFLREAEVSAHLKHEHILPLFEFGEEQGRLFLVTPYIEGGTLAQRLHNGPLPLSEVQQLFTALLRAVSYIHKRGVIHRDLKPSNILLDQEEGSDQIYVRRHALDRRDAEIDESHVDLVAALLLVEQDVTGLEVAMDHAAFMNVGHSAQQRCEELLDFRERQGTVVQALGQRAAFNIGCNQEEASLLFTELEEGQDVLVLEMRTDLRLTKKAFAGRQIVYQVGANDLHGHLAPECGPLARQVDLAHASYIDAPDQFVVPETPPVPLIADRTTLLSDGTLLLSHSLPRYKLHHPLWGPACSVSSPLLSQPVRRSRTRSCILFETV